jgi:hypothetical protein
LDALKLVTKAKARGILLKMLREADLLSAENRISPTMWSPFFLDAIGSEKRDEVVFFPILEY